MFNPFTSFPANPFQAATDAAQKAGQAANNAGGGNAFSNPFSGLTSGPFGPAFGATKEKIESGMQDLQSQWQTLFNPQKLFEGAFNMDAVKSLFPKELTQAWAAFMPQANGSANGQASSQAASTPNPMEQMKEMGQQFANQAQQTMQAFQTVAQQAAQQGAAPTGAVSSNLGSVDLSALIAAQQKNMETLSQAQTATVSGWQQVMKRQSEIFHDTMQTAASAMNELLATGAPEEKLARQADIAKQAFETAGKNIEELARLVTEGNQEALRVVSARVQESLDEIKAAAQKNPLTKAASDAAEQTKQAAGAMMQSAAKAAGTTVGTTGDAVQ